jgi:hypothetical protein
MFQFLFGLLADVVIESVTGARHSFTEEMNRYLEQRGLARDPAPHRASVR